MRRLLGICIFFFSTFSWAQSDEVLKAFDFWVGDWEAHWVDAKGNKIVAENKIHKIAGGTVIQENFSDTTNQFFGTSISVFSTVDSTWHQTWADNAGAYIDLFGIVEDGVRIFQTEPVVKGDQTIVRRMLFYNITPTAFTWDWEISADGGKTWKLAWQIQYVRKKRK